MKTLKLIILGGLLSLTTQSMAGNPKKTVRIAVIDTGYDITMNPPEDYKAIFCTSAGRVMDYKGHGTNMMSIIAHRLNRAGIDYCIIPFSLERYHEALEKLQGQRPDYVNMSFSGSGYFSFECRTLKKLLDAGVQLFAAAGNNGTDIDIHPEYPASCDVRIHVQGFATPDGLIDARSNYSKKPNFKVVGNGSMTTVGLDGRLELTNGSSAATALELSNAVIKDSKGE